MKNNYLTKIFTTENAKQTLINGLIKLAYVDGQVDKTELQVIQEIANTLGLNQDLPSLLDVESTNIHFGNKEQETYFFKEAIRLAIIDGHYSKSEMKFLKSLSVNFNWDEKEFSNFEDAQKDLHWLKRTQSIELD